MRKIITYLAFALILTSLNSCILVPAIDSIKKVGLTEGDRKQLLSTNVKLFHDCLYWGNPNDAMALIDEKSVEVLGAQVRESIEDTKIVESKVKNVSFEDDAYIAYVEVSTSAFKVPVYIVNKRLEREKWRFSLSDGWKIVEIKDITKK